MPVVTENISWFARIKNAFVSVIIGVVLVIAAIILLWWNEGRTVATAKALAQAQNQVISVSSATINPANNQKLVHMSGFANTQEVLVDKSFSFSLKAIKLIRNVSMYQWQQETKTTTHKSFGGSEEKKTDYTYRKIWSGHLINSNNFKFPNNHQNPSQMMIQSQTMQAKKVHLGAFLLSPSQINQIGNKQVVPISGLNLQEISQKLGEKVEKFGNYLYFGKNPKAPVIGDIRVQFSAVMPQEISIIAQQAGRSFVPFISKSDKQVSLLVSGQQSAKEMILKAKEHNEKIAWLLRLGGFVGIAIGLMMILNPLVVIADVVPLLGDFLSFGIGVSCFTVAFCVSCLVISVAWMRFHPVIGVGMIVLAIAAFFVLYRYKEKHKQSKKMTKES